MEVQINPATGQVAFAALLAGGLLLYGVLHGALIVWVWRNREVLLIPTLLFMSPVGVCICVLAAIPFIGWAAALTVIAALIVGFIPVAGIVGWAILNRKEDGLR